jgi:hypothetical protein
VIGVSARFSQYLPVEQRNQRGAFFVIAEGNFSATKIEEA